MQLQFIKMPKFTQQVKEDSIDMNDRLAKWLRFLNKAIVDILKTASLDSQIRMQYEAREKALKDIASIRGDGVREGRQEGIKEGKKEGKLEIAKKMLKKDMDIEIIVEMTELFEGEIIRLKDEMNH